MRQVFLDTETTGLAAEQGDRIIEIGCVEMVNRQLTGNNLHHYINPERDSSEGALAVHGLTREFLTDKPKFGAIAQELIGYLDGAELVIHNAAFDVGFLNAELTRLGQRPIAQIASGIVDSLAVARELFPGKSASLDALCKRFEVDNTSRTLHGALLDAGLLAEVYVRMTRGQHTLDMDVDAHANHPQALHGGAVETINLATLDLQVLTATTEERTLHGAMLARLDKDSNGKTLWRALVP